jgi:uncharacterized membrane protein
MRYMVQAFLVLLLVIEPIAGYAQTPGAQSAPSVSGISSPSTSQAPQITENTPAQPATGASLPSTPQTQQAPDSPPPDAAPPPANTTKAKPKRHHLSGFNIGIIVGNGILLYILLNMDRG